MQQASIQRRFWLNMRWFFEGARLSYIGTFRWLRPSTYLASKIIMPINQLLFFTFLGIYATSRSNADFYVIGNALQLVAINGIYGVTMGVGSDRSAGTLPYIFGVPTNRLLLFLGRAVFHIIDGFFGVWLGLGMGVLLLGLDLSAANPLLLALAIMVATLSTSCMGLLFGSLSLVTVNVFFFNNVVYFLLLLFSGANIPRDEMPAWMYTIGEVLPLTRTIEACRTIISGGAWADVDQLLGMELLIGLMYAVLGFVIFRTIEYQARLHGTIERF